MNDLNDDQWMNIIHGDGKVTGGDGKQNLLSPLEPLPNKEGDGVTGGDGKNPSLSNPQNNSGLVPFASGLAQPDRTKPLAEFWGVSESAIKRWCKGVAELHGVNPVTPYTDAHLCYLAEFGIRCSDRWAEFKGQTGLTRRLSPAEYVQSQLSATGKGSQQRLQQTAQGVGSVNAADVQDAIADRRQAVKNQVADQVMAMATDDYHSGKALAQQASQLLNGQAFLAGFMGELASELGNDSITISLLPGGSTNYLPDR